MPSSVRFGSRPMMERMSLYSSAVSPCSAMMLGVMAPGEFGAAAAGLAAAEEVGADVGDKRESLGQGVPGRGFLQCGRDPVNL